MENSCWPYFLTYFHTLLTSFPNFLEINLVSLCLYSDYQSSIYQYQFSIAFKSTERAKSSCAPFSFMHKLFSFMHELFSFMHELFRILVHFLIFSTVLSNFLTFNWFNAFSSKFNYGCFRIIF